MNRFKLYSRTIVIAEEEDANIGGPNGMCSPGSIYQDESRSIADDDLEFQLPPKKETRQQLGTSVWNQRVSPPEISPLKWLRPALTIASFENRSINPHTGQKHNSHQFNGERLNCCRQLCFSSPPRTAKSSPTSMDETSNENASTTSSMKADEDLDTVSSPHQVSPVDMTRVGDGPSNKETEPADVSIPEECRIKELAMHQWEIQALEALRHFVTALFQIGQVEQAERFGRTRESYESILEALRTMPEIIGLLAKELRATRDQLERLQKSYLDQMTLLRNAFHRIQRNQNVLVDFGCRQHNLDLPSEALSSTERTRYLLSKLEMKIRTLNQKIVE